MKRMSDEIFFTDTYGDVQVYGRTTLFDTEEQFRGAALKAYFTKYEDPGVILKVQRKLIRINPCDPEEDFLFWVGDARKSQRGAWESWVAYIESESIHEWRNKK